MCFLANCRSPVALLTEIIKGRKVSALVYRIGLLLGIQLLHQNCGDAVAFHVCDGEPPPAVLRGIFHLRDMTELKEQEAGKSFEAGLAGKNNMVASLELPNGGAALQQQNLLLIRRRRPHNIVFISYVAEYLFKDVGERHQSRHGAEFIHYQGHMRVVDSKLTNQLVERLRFRHHKRLANKAPQTGMARPSSGDLEQSGVHPKRGAGLYKEGFQ